MRRLYFALLTIFLSLAIFLAMDFRNSSQDINAGIPEGPQSSVLNLNVSESSNSLRFSEGERIKLKVDYYTSPPPQGFLESLHNLTEGDRIRVSTRNESWTAEFISFERKELDSVDQEINIGNSPDWNQRIIFLSMD